MDSQIPCVFVASKTDLPEASQQPGLSPAEFCYKHCLPPPFLFSCHSQGPPGTAVYTKLATAATFPLVSIPPGAGGCGLGAELGEEGCWLCPPAPHIWCHFSLALSNGSFVPCSKRAKGTRLPSALGVSLADLLDKLPEQDFYFRSLR